MGRPRSPRSALTVGRRTLSPRPHASSGRSGVTLYCFRPWKQRSGHTGTRWAPRSTLQHPVREGFLLAVRPRPGPGPLPQPLCPQVKELGAVVRNCSRLARDLEKVFQTYWLLGGPRAVLPKHWPHNLSSHINHAQPLRARFDGVPTTAYFSVRGPPRPTGTARPGPPRGPHAPAGSWGAQWGCRWLCPGGGAGQGMQLSAPTGDRRPEGCLGGLSKRGEGGRGSSSSRCPYSADGRKPGGRPCPGRCPQPRGWSRAETWRQGGRDPGQGVTVGGWEALPGTGPVSPPPGSARSSSWTPNPGGWVQGGLPGPGTAWF